MSDEFKHEDITTGVLTEAAHEGIGTHIFDSQAIGDIMIAISATQLSRLAKGTQGRPLVMGASIPQWGGDLRQADSDKIVLGTDLDVTIAWIDGTSKLEFRDADNWNILWYNRSAAGFGSWAVLQNRAYDAATQAPAFGITQTSTGECAFRFQHDDKPAANYDWFMGMVGRTNGGTAQTDFCIWLDQDGSAMSFRSLTAAEKGAGSNVAVRVSNLFH